MEDTYRSKEELIKEKNLEFAQKFNANSIDAFEKLYTLKNKRKISSDQVQKYVENPYSNASNLQNVMQYMININGVVKEMMLYKSEMLTLDHYLICSDMSKYKDKTKFDNAYRKAVYDLKKYNIKFNIPWMMKRLIKDGELFIYKIEDSDGITFLPIPTSYCKITSAKGGIQYYSINLDSINNDTVSAFPDEVQKLYDKKCKGELRKDEKYKDGFYPLDKKYAYAFSLEYLVPKNVPYYTSLLRNLCRLCDMEELDDANAILSNFKLIQMLIPTDKETGEILVDADEAIAYFNDTKKELPERIGFVGLPYDLKPITLGDMSAKEIDYTDKLKKSTYDSAGINDELFNGSKSNNQSVIYSQITDSLLPLTLLEQFRLFLNEDFKHNTSLKNFELCFINSTRYNYSEIEKQMMSNVTTYNSKLQLLAAQHHDPHQAYNILKQEELMGLNDLMRPMITSHTATSGEVSNGRPKANEDDLNKVGQAQN